EESARHRLQAGELLRIPGPLGHQGAITALRAFQEDPHFLLDLGGWLAGHRDREDELGTPLDDDGPVAELEPAQLVRADGARRAPPPGSSTGIQSPRAARRLWAATLRTRVRAARATLDSSAERGSGPRPT